MKLAAFIISPMLCDFSLFYRQMSDDSEYPDYSVFAPESPKFHPKLGAVKLMMQLQLVESLRQEVDNLSQRPKDHGIVRKVKLAEPFHQNIQPRKQKCRWS